MDKTDGENNIDFLLPVYFYVRYLRELSMFMISWQFAIDACCCSTWTNLQEESIRFDQRLRQNYTTGIRRSLFVKWRDVIVPCGKPVPSSVTSMTFVYIIKSTIWCKPFSLVLIVSTLNFSCYPRHLLLIVYIWRLVCPI